MIRRILSVAGLALALAAPAEARSDITVDQTLVAGGASYLQLTVTTGGAFDIWTTSRLGAAGATPFDPVMFLFAGAGTAGPVVATDDDGCFAFLAQCGPAAAGGFNALLNNIFLSVGPYTVAVGGFSFTEAEARSGVNPGNLSAGDFSIRIASTPEFIGTLPPGTAVVAEIPVAEPGSLSLLAMGLVGLGAVVRRIRTARRA